MKPWVLPLIMLIYGVVMLLPVLGGIKNKHPTGCVAKEEGGLPWPGMSGIMIQAPISGSPFKGSESSLKQGHPGKIRLDVPSLASLQAPSLRSESNNGYVERKHSFCLHFISSQEIIFSSVRPL